MKTKNQNSKTDIKLKLRNKIWRSLIFFPRFSSFDFSIFNYEVTFFSLLQGLSKCACVSIFFLMIFLIYEHCLSQVSSKWRLTKLGHFILLKRKFSHDPATKPLNGSIYFLKNILKFHNFQETRASSTVASETNRANKIILNIFGVAM